jgi:hypothetical protein
MCVPSLDGMDGCLENSEEETRRRKSGGAEQLSTVGIEMDYDNYLYYLDGDGDIARKKRQT